MSGRIVLATFGSLGDLHPVIALGRELAGRGHEPVVATSEFYREAVESEGLSFHPVRPDIDPEDHELFEKALHPRKGPEAIVREWLLPSLRQSWEDTRAACAGADLIVGSDVAFQAAIVAEADGIARASFTLAPMAFLSAYDPPVLPAYGALVRMARWSPALGRPIFAALRAISGTWFGPVHDLRAEIGLPPGEHPMFGGKDSRRLVLAMFSRALAEPAPDWPAATVVTGYAFHDRAPGGAPDPETRAFLEADPPPIVFTLGSAVSRRETGWWRVARDAALALDRRALIVLGPDPATRLAPAGGIRVVDYAPYSEVFPRAAAVVHQGGAGTTGQALRAGVPQLIVPFAHDQPDNAARVARLGAARTIPSRRWGIERAREALAELLGDPAYGRRAREVAGVVRSEGGAAAAADAIEREFGRELA